MTPIPVPRPNRIPGWLLYGVWGLLFAFSLFYQVRRTGEFFRNPSPRLGGINTEHLTAIVNLVPPGSALQIGDRLETVNGVPFRGFAQLNRAAYLARPGDQLFLEVTRHGKRIPVSLRWLPSKPRQRDIATWAVEIFTSLVMPWFAILFGFWLLHRRPRDPLAWLFLVIMLSFSRFFGWGGFGWENYLRQAALFTNVLFDLTHAPGFVLLGMYFGSRWPQRALVYLGWVIAGAVTTLGFLRAVDRVWASEDSLTAGPFNSFVLRLNLLDWLIFPAYGLFFYFLFGKYFTAHSPDLKRRLRILLVTMNVSLFPALFYFLIRGLFFGGDNSQMPKWASLVAFALMSLVPMSLAYVILVHRAVDVGVVVRSGLRYTMARGGVFFLQLVVAVIGIIWAVRYMENQHHLGSGVHAAILAAYAALLFTVRWLSGPLFGWIDRLFFRNAYSSEQVMADLTEQVRTVLDPQELFQTVSERLKAALHVEDVTFFLRNGNGFAPAYATGLQAVSNFPDDSVPVKRLATGHEPLQIFLDDLASWCNRPEVATADRERLVSLGTQVLLPLSSADRLVGFASLGPKRSEEPYTNNDLRLLKAVGSQAGLALENSRLASSLATEAAQKERVHRELEIASEVQQRLFPQKSLIAEGVELAGLCRPALAVGGDYFDYFPLENGTVGLAVGDVAGKGLGAALVMATLQASLRTQVLDGDPDLASLLSRLNQVVYEASTRNRFATLFYAQYHQVSRQLTYVNAGHNPPFILRASGAVERLALTGIAVGLKRKRAYQQATVTLAPGDLLVAFTDGISEAMNHDREEWGEERLAACVAQLPGVTPQQAIAQIIAHADAFAAGATQHDDMTMVVLRVA